MTSHCSTPGPSPPHRKCSGARVKVPGSGGKAAPPGVGSSRHYAVPVAIDLHTHSSASDGTEAPAVVVAQAVAAGLDTLALTDHDTTLGWAEASAADGARHRARARHRGLVHPSLAEHPPARLPARPRAPRPRRRARSGRARAATPASTAWSTKMAAAGIPVTLEAVRAEVEEGATAGRPHIADALVTAGVVEHRDEAFARWLGNDSPYYVAHYAPDPVHAVRWCGPPGECRSSRTRGRAPAGGSSPTRSSRSWPPRDSPGLEVHHRDHDADAVRHLTDLAAVPRPPRHRVERLPRRGQAATGSASTRRRPRSSRRSSPSPRGPRWSAP